MTAAYVVCQPTWGSLRNRFAFLAEALRPQPLPTQFLITRPVSVLHFTPLGLPVSPRTFSPACITVFPLTSFRAFTTAFSLTVSLAFYPSFT